MSTRKIALFVSIMVLILCIPQTGYISGSEHEDVLVLDMEEDSVYVEHGGTLDLWDRGIPGGGNVSNPGPGSAGEGDMCYGSPLNGTYAEGTRSYLMLSEIPVPDHRYLKLSYLIWYDLDLRGDERNDSGSSSAGDHLLVQVREEGDEWTTLTNHSGDSGGEWTLESVDLSFHESEFLTLRFLLVDMIDGMEDNGVFLDLLTVSGEPRPDVEIYLEEPPTVAGTVSTGGSSLIHYTVVNEGRQIPDDTFVSIEIKGPENFQPVEYRDTVNIEGEEAKSFRWEPLDEGIYIVNVNLTVDGEVVETHREIVESLDPVFFDEFSLGSGDWEFKTEEGEPGWTITDYTSFSLTSSSGPFLSFPNGSGFSGPILSSATSPMIDLSGMDDAHVHLFQSYGFLGAEGSCGGLVQASDDQGDWITLEPDLPHTRELDPSVEGPFGGEYGFRGDRDWYQIGFDLTPVAGGETKLRFVATSSQEGEGRGWSLDDIIVTAEGFDPYDEEPPEPVQGLQVEVLEDGRVEITWDPSFARDIMAYNLFLGTGKKDLSEDNIEKTISADNGTAIIIDDLDSSKQYWVAVTAVDRNGNEDLSVNAIFFSPAMESVDNAPVAEARVVGSRTGEMGDIFIFNASSSYDPEGKAISIEWTFPDGTTDEGVEVLWESSVSGEDLVVSMVVEDGSGLKGYDNITIDVSEDTGSDLESEDIDSFIVCMAPVVISLLIAVIIVAWIRASRQRKIRRELLRMGLQQDGARSTFEAEVTDDGPDDKRSKRRTVQDLEPILETKVKKRKPGRVPPPPPPSSPIKTGGSDEVEVKKEEPRRASLTRSVTALVECPFCNASFRTSIDREKVSGGEPIRMTCPECGRSGLIGD